jgi:hypothetical protein
MAGDRPSITTVIAISAAAYALADMVHEALGHGLLSLLVPGVKAISISTVALPTTGSSRIVPAAGMIANIIAGIVSLWLFATRRQFTPGSYFLWLFAGVNLMNIGYLSYSGILRRLVRCLRRSADRASLARGADRSGLRRLHRRDAASLRCDGFTGQTIGVG